MTIKRIDFQSFSIACPNAWEDITDTLEDEDPPLTLADPEPGIGVLQFSPAYYRGGPAPSPSLEDLAEMVEEFGAAKGFGRILAKSSFANENFGAGAEYHVDECVIVVWYVSDGKNIMLVTYCRRLGFKRSRTKRTRGSGPLNSIFVNRYQSLRFVRACGLLPKI